MNQPIILREGSYTEDNLKQLQEQYHIWEEVDIFEMQLKELFEITYVANTHENLFQQFLDKKIYNSNIDLSGNWIYFPWNGYLIHSVNEEDYTQLRTNRNKLFITEAEQTRLLAGSVGFLGLSIGSHFVLSHAYSGIANKMKLADFDRLETSNLNRVKASIKDIGKAKIEIALEQLYEINPYQKVKNFDIGINKENIDDFFEADFPLDIIFEAIDDFEMKVKIRIEARQRKIPVIMLTNLGDSILIDIERYDLNPTLPLFNGLIGETPEIILKEGVLNESDKVKYAAQIVGSENLPAKAVRSLLEINKTLVGRPQLYSTVVCAGGIAAYITKRILLNQSLSSGRFRTSFTDWFGIKDEELNRLDLLQQLTKAISER